MSKHHTNWSFRWRLCLLERDFTLCSHDWCQSFLLSPNKTSRRTSDTLKKSNFLSNFFVLYDEVRNGTLGEGSLVFNQNHIKSKRVYKCKVDPRCQLKTEIERNRLAIVVSFSIRRGIPRLTLRKVCRRAGTTFVVERQFLSPNTTNLQNNKRKTFSV